MKNLTLFFVFGFLLLLTFSCGAQPEKSAGKPAVQGSEQVAVYYFHFTRRCITCQAIESQSRQIISELYGDQVSFNAFNLDENDGAVKGKELDISGQTLLIVRGDTKINLTSEGFMYARNDPEKFKKILKERIDKML
ncbi:MAG TPA: nitrophenyl compound nitroreductase subunit ArsF family protein [Cyclobacteriaceae bacterium]|nr:nitrophenyl compound nitroreductase subunit ArsF family protein [Cyclobacteriaceae bacterium]